MWTDSTFARRLNLRAPIIQGPFGGGLSSVALTAAVAEAGGLGSFGVHHLDAAGIEKIAAEIRAKTAKPFALNLWIPMKDSSADPDQTQVSAEQWAAHEQRFRPFFEALGVAMPPQSAFRWPDYQEQVEAVLAARPAVFSFVFGAPSREVLAACRARGILTLGTATTVEEARYLQDAGVDMLVATGFEAGGHRVAFLKRPEEGLTGSLSLLPQVVDAVDIPVIAAGGIADGRGVAAALMLGAQGVQIGTAFLACEESNASSIHREKLFSPAARDTALTRAFSGRLARGIRNDLLTKMQAADMPGYPLHTWWLGHLKSAAVAQGRADAMALWCGQSAGLLKHRRARELFEDLVAQTSRRLR